MIGGLFMAFVAAIALAFLLARFSKNPAQARGEIATREHANPAPRISPVVFHELVAALLRTMKLRLIEYDHPALAVQRMVAVQPGPLRDARFLLLLDVTPPGDMVEPTTALELVEEARANWGTVGVLVTPYAFDQTGVAALDEIERIDGERLRALFAQYLPARLAELESYQLGGPTTSSESEDSLSELVADESFDDDDWHSTDDRPNA